MYYEMSKVYIILNIVYQTKYGVVNKKDGKGALEFAWSCLVPLRGAGCC
jgi:hypothetical protein